MDKTSKTVPTVFAVLLVVAAVVALAVAIGFPQTLTMIGLAATATVFYLLLRVSAS